MQPNSRRFPDTPPPPTSSPNSRPTEVPEPIVVSDVPGRKRRHRSQSKPRKEVPPPKNLFSDETARFLLRILKGQKELPATIALPAEAAPATKSRETDPPSAPDVQEELAAAIREKLRPWLWSFLLHALLLTCLALMFLPKIEHARFDIISGIGEDETELTRELGLHAQDDETTFFSLTALPPVERPLLELPSTPDLAETGPEVRDAPTPEQPVGLSIDPRDPGSRADRLGKGGGNDRTDRAVVAGLRWLVRVQFPDGSWRLCGPYPNGAIRNYENRNAATAMALLAFQGYGVTPESRHPMFVEFARTVRNGWDWLLRQQDPETGCFFRDGTARQHEHRFYTHGLCTIALCERLAMTNDASLREPAQKAVDYCVRYQSVQGGWRYRADRRLSGSDVSVTGWIVMALQSGRMAGLSIPAETFENVSKFLDSVARDGESQYGYRVEEPELRVSMTAEALLCRELLGWRRDDRRLRRGVDVLVRPENLPDFETYPKRDAYYWYYATQTLHHYGGEPWRVWNERMRDGLLRHQEQRGPEAGSWHPILPVADQWGNHHGRLYTTCLSIYILEVYYRHARIYGD